MLRRRPQGGGTNPEPLREEIQGLFYLVQGSILGGPFDLVSRVSKVGYGDYKRVSRGY